MSVYTLTTLSSECEVVDFTALRNAVTAGKQRR